MYNNYLLGAINKKTNRYENIMSVEKTNEYKCIGCDSDLILRKGEKKFQNFIHKQKNQCEYFKNPSEQILINDAFSHLKELLDTNIVTIFSKCSCCKFKFETKLPKFDFTTKNSNSVECLCGTETVCAFVVNDVNNYTNVPVHKINIQELIVRITIGFSSKKVELVSGINFKCEQCKKY